MARKKNSGAIDQSLVEELARTVRSQVLEALFIGPAGPRLIAIETGVPLKNVCYHVRVLEECGSIELDRKEEICGETEHFYRLVPQAFLGSHRCRKVPSGLGSAAFATGLQTVRLDERGQKEATAIFANTRQALRKAHDKSKKRLSRKREPGTTFIVGFAGFEAARRRGTKCDGEGQSDAGE